MHTVARHYDGVGVQSLAQRAEGPAYALKKYHNAVKRDLYDRFASVKLVDLCCGRGGDLHKWKADEVIGLDVSETELREARRRAAGTGVKCRFECRDLRQGFDIGKVHSASAMFCLNYFWETEDVAATFLDSVEKCLEPHGTFFGCYADATAVRAWVAQGTTSALAEICPLPTFYDPGEFGQAYTFRLKDTVLERPCPEYLVSAGSLKKLCAERGLHQIWSKPFAQGPDVASGLYRAFAFVKL